VLRSAGVSQSGRRTRLLIIFNARHALHQPLDVQDFIRGANPPVFPIARHRERRTTPLPQEAQGRFLGAATETKEGSPISGRCEINFVAADHAAVTGVLDVRVGHSNRSCMSVRPPGQCLLTRPRERHAPYDRQVLHLLSRQSDIPSIRIRRPLHVLANLDIASSRSAGNGPPVAAPA